MTRKRLEELRKAVAMRGRSSHIRTKDAAVELLALVDKLLPVVGQCANDRSFAQISDTQELACLIIRELDSDGKER